MLDETKLTKALKSLGYGIEFNSKNPGLFIGEKKYDFEELVPMFKPSINESKANTLYLEKYEMFVKMVYNNEIEECYLINETMSIVDCQLAIRKLLHKRVIKFITIDVEYIENGTYRKAKLMDDCEEDVLNSLTHFQNIVELEFFITLSNDNIVSLNIINLKTFSISYKNIADYLYDIVNQEKQVLMTKLSRNSDENKIMQYVLRNVECEKINKLVELNQLSKENAIIVSKDELLELMKVK